MQMALAFAGLVVIGAMAMAMYELFSAIEKHTTAWAHRGSQGESSGLCLPILFQETSMIKVSVMYPEHCRRPIRSRLLPRQAHAAGQGADGRRLQVLHGRQGPGRRRAGQPATYVGMCHIFCDSVEAFQAGFGPHAKEIMADIANYTDLDR